MWDELRHCSSLAKLPSVRRLALGKPLAPHGAASTLRSGVAKRWAMPRPGPRRASLRWHALCAARARCKLGRARYSMRHGGNEKGNALARGCPHTYHFAPTLTCMSGKCSTICWRSAPMAPINIATGLASRAESLGHTLSRTSQGSKRWRSIAGVRPRSPKKRLIIMRA